MVRHFQEVGCERRALLDEFFFRAPFNVRCQEEVYLAIRKAQDERIVIRQFRRRPLAGRPEHVGPSAIPIVSVALGAVNGFLLNRRWTFREHVGDALTPVRWAVVQGCGLAVNEGMLYVLVHDAHLEKILAQVAATVIVTITTFLANRAWTFRAHTPVAVAGGPSAGGDG